MLTLILCLVGVGVVCKLWWKTESFAKVTAGWVMVGVLVLFGTGIPITIGENAATRGDLIRTMPVAEYDGKYYYDDNGIWKDTETISVIGKADTMMVGIKKAPKSLWYWPMEVKVLYLPLGEGSHE